MVMKMAGQPKESLAKPNSDACSAAPMYTDQSSTPTTVEANALRRLLAKYGFENVPDFLDEWNVCRQDRRLRGTPKATADTFAVLLGMQKTGTAMLCYYDARVGPSVYGGMFNPDTHYPYRAYYGFKAFGTAYRLGDETENACETEGVILIANTNPSEVELTFDAAGADMTKGEVIITDDEHLYTLVGPVVKENVLTVKAHACVKIRLPL